MLRTTTVAFDQRHDLLGHLVEVEPHAFSGAFAQQFAQALNHLIDAVFVGDDVLEYPAHRRQIHMHRRRAVAARSAHDCGCPSAEIQLVRQRGRQLVHRRDTRDLRQLVATPLRGVFGAAPR